MADRDETEHGYELLDFGRDAAGVGRKLERFGGVILDRPATAAGDVVKSRPNAWAGADARYELNSGAGDGPRRGVWSPAETLGSAWPIEMRVPGIERPLQLELKATEFGHVGLFPEQADNWAWLVAQVRAAPTPPTVLNLFAYTGASTLALAAAGAAVTHVDAAAGVVSWARRNAELSGLAQAPVRWICEDALKFARRELKRGRRYDGVVLDPPSYGHGPKGEPWVFFQHLPELLQACHELMAENGRFVLCTSHTTGVAGDNLAEMVRPLLPRATVQSCLMQLGRTNGALLPAGEACRLSVDR